MAIDLAGGDGAGALWLALLGFSPVLVEVSDVALLLAEQAANERGVDLVTSRVDLTDETIASVVHRIGGDPGTEAVAAQPVALIGCFHYLNRRLLASVAAGLPAGAMFLASIATMTNLERNERPSARFLLQPGELRSLVVDGVESAPETGLDVIHDAEGWTPEGTHEATIIVSRSPLK
ncbi:MAG: class I SAM-dependent methyltransferase [Actinomycetota bacterium]